MYGFNINALTIFKAYVKAFFFIISSYNCSIYFNTCLHYFLLIFNHVYFLINYSILIALLVFIIQTRAKNMPQKISFKMFC